MIFGESPEDKLRERGYAFSVIDTVSNTVENFSLDKGANIVTNLRASR